MRKRAKHAQRKTLSQQTWQADHFQAPTLILDHTAGIRVAEATESPTEAEGGLRTGTHPNLGMPRQVKRACTISDTRKRKEDEARVASPAPSAHA